jgi:succinate dehydrogenase / fumarate reductase membrane anchor subunit
MADNRADTRVDMRTPLSRVKGLGAAHHGVEHWWMHRITAMSNIPLIVSFVIIVASLAGRPYAEAIRIISNPLVALLLILCVISVTNHMRLGLQIIIDDYVHDRGWKIGAVIANNFFAAVIAAACLFSVLKISFGRVPLPPV